MNRKRYEGLPPDLRKVIDDTTGLSLSHHGSTDYDKQNARAIELAKKERTVYQCSNEEYQKWLAFFAPLIKSEAGRVDKLGLQGSKLVQAYKLMA
jgi:TRAP-type C4-dicarboxylate transport system substrate-binding protein